jgi:hypothetical protein
MIIILGEFQYNDNSKFFIFDVLMKEFQNTKF